MLKKGKKGQNIWKFARKCTKFEHILKKGWWLCAIIAPNKLLEKALTMYLKNKLCPRYFSRILPKHWEQLFFKTLSDFLIKTAEAMWWNFFGWKEKNSYKRKKGVDWSGLGEKKRIFKGQKKMQGKSKKLALVILIQDLSLQKLLTYYQRSLQRNTLKNQHLLKVFGQ